MADTTASHDGHLLMVTRTAGAESQIEIGVNRVWRDSVCGRRQQRVQRDGGNPERSDRPGYYA